MLAEILGGVLGGALGGTHDGAGAQQANAEAFRRVHDSYRAAPTPEQAAEAMRGAQNAYAPPYPDPVVRAAWRERRALDDSFTPDWLFWGLLAAMALALAIRYWMQFARSAL